MSSFEKLGEREIWRGAVISVAEGTFASPKGDEFQRDLVHHPGAVSVVPVDGDEVVLVRQYRAAVDQEVLEIPAGKRDVDGEDPEVTANRELAEEVGLHAGKLEKLAEFFNSLGFSDELSHVYLGTELTEVPKALQGVEEEHMTIERIRLDDVPALIAARELVDAKTVIGLLLARERLRVDTAVVPLEVEEYLTWLATEKGRSANTLTAYRRDLRAYSAWLEERGLALGEVQVTDVESYVGVLRDEGRAPATVARAIVAVRSMHAFCASEGILPVDPAADVEPPSVPRGLPKGLSEEEVERLLAVVVGTDAVARRDRAILEVLYGTGIRIAELVGLSLGELDVDDALVRVLGKGNKERVLPIGRLALESLHEWLAADGRPAMAPERWARRGDAEAVFLNQRGGRLTRQGAWLIVQEHGRRAGLDRELSPHTLRHSCATHMLDHGADIRAVQELLGHASISTTQIYTGVSVERLFAVYGAAHPRARPTD